MAIDPQAEILRLRTALRDLVALSSIPAAWVGREPPDIAAGLADVLVGSLHLDFAYVRLCDPNGGAAVEVTGGNLWKTFPEWLERHLAVVGQLSRREIIPEVGGGEELCRGVVLPIGVNAEGGLVAAACDRSDFPTEIDQLLLSVAANHAATAFQNARLIHGRKKAEEELRQARDELEIKVVERTAELRRATAELETILDASPVGIALFSRDEVVQRSNRAFERIFGWAADEIAGRPLTVPAANQKEWSELGEKLNRGEAFVNVETRLLRKDGSEFDAAVAWAPFEDERGRATGFVGTIEDISDRKRAEEALRRSEAYLAEAQRLSHTGSWAWKVATRELVHWSRELYRMHGLDPERGLPSFNSVIERTQPEDRARALEVLERAIREKTDFEVDFRTVLPSGEMKYLHGVGHPVFDASGDAVEVVGTTMDVTERKRADEERERLLASERAARAEAVAAQHRFRDLVNSVDGIVWEAEAETLVFSFVNEQAERILGYPIEQWLKEPTFWKDRLHPDDRDWALDFRLKATAENRNHDFEYRVIAADGHIVWLRDLGTVVVEGDRVTKLRGVMVDITKRKRAEETLREQANLLNLTHDSVFVCDMNDIITYWNRGAEELYGWTREEAVGQVSHQLTQTTFPAPLEEINAELLGTGRWEGELIHTKRDGRQVVVASRWSLQRDEQGQPVAILETNNNITERKRAETDLRDRERRYRSIFQGAGVSIWEEDFSQVKAAIDKLKAQGVEDFRQYTAAHPEFVQQAISMVKVIDVNDATVRLFEAQSKDEVLVSLDKTFLPETEEVFAGELIAIAEGRTSFESETIVQTLKGGKLTVLFAITFPPQPAKLDSVLVSIMDITERKQAEEELRKAQAELAHVTRVMTMGELASSIAHEVNQPLTAVVTNGNACLRWLAGEPPNLDEARESLRRIIRDGKRAGEVIAGIRALVKRSASAKERLDLYEMIHEVLVMIDTEARGHRVLVRTELAAGLPPVRGDRVQLQQVILNLVMNGIEAMKAVTERPRELLIKSNQSESDKVLVAVQDTGIGLDQESLDRIFNAFYTTKPDGMGMGLSISRSIVEANGGRLWATPNDGPGATFQFTLPMHSAEKGGTGPDPNSTVLSPDTHITR